MRKQDYEILAAAIKKHRDTAIFNIEYSQGTNQKAMGAKEACEKIAGTFAHFAHVKKDEFMKACGIE